MSSNENKQRVRKTVSMNSKASKELRQQLLMSMRENISLEK